MVEHFAHIRSDQRCQFVSGNGDMCENCPFKVPWMESFFGVRKLTGE